MAYPSCYKIVSTQLESLCFITAKVNATSVKALVDSGSFFSLVSRRLIHKLKLPIVPFSKEDETTRLYGASGAPIHLLGKCELLLNISSLVLPISTFVCGNLSEDLLIGRSFLTDASANIDFKSKIITFSDCINVEMHDKMQKTLYFVLLIL